MTTKPVAISRELYLEVSIRKVPQHLDAPARVVAPCEADRPSLGEVSKVLHDIADQVLEGVPVGQSAIDDRFVADWQFGGALDDPDLAEAKAEPSPAGGNDLERGPRRTDEFEEPEITEVSGFRIPPPRPVARASTKKNARPIYRYFPFKPGSLASGGGWQAAARALKVFTVLHAAYRGPERLRIEDLQPLFFRSSSELITYREGWKAGRFWSVEAFKQALNEKHTKGLISEHVMPRSQTLMRALEIESMGQAAEFVWDNSFECVVTSKENNELTRQDAKRRRGIWVFEKGPWERYLRANIHILDVECNGQKWLTPGDRESALNNSFCPVQAASFKPGAAA
jgi:hypothetical protein